MKHACVGGRIPGIELVGQVLVVAVVLIGLVVPATSQALSCLAPAEAIPQQLSADSDTLAFTGTVTAVREVFPRTTITTVAVETAHKGAVPATIEIAYQYSKDWGYGCSSSPSAVGETKTFLVYQNPEGTFVGGISFTEADALYDVFATALATQNPSSTIVTDTTTTAETATLSQLQRLLDQLKAQVDWLWRLVF